MYNIFGILCFIISRVVKTHLKLKNRFVQVYGEGAVTDWTCQQWFVKFCSGNFLLDDAPQSGRWVEVVKDQTETLIENDQRYTMWEIDDKLKISKSIKLSVKMKNVSYFMEKTKWIFGQLNIMKLIVLHFMKSEVQLSTYIFSHNVSYNQQNQ